MNMKVSSSIPSSFIDLPMMMIIIISPLLPTAISDDNQLRASSCSGKQTHPGTLFYRNRKYIMTFLAKYTPLRHGFATTSWVLGPKVFGQIDTANKVHMCSGQTANNKYTIKTKGLLNKLVGEVVKQRDRYSMFASDETSGEFVVYGMVQCTRDLDVNKCKGCLQNVMKDISSAGADCLPKTSGSFFSGSCVVRYDKSPFLL
ncbi:hypothetical protein CASFOL_012718 [Castilleja foliolosa]|uniref:Gnk2-homologous domain-containing protein n=1 Tax=Castilleja foliolosa TaxID=1961234 RepID=A0ABD3DI14_9LAMI